MKAARMRRPRRGPLRRRLSSCREEEAPGVPAADLASPCVWPRACSSAAPVPWVPPVGPSRTRGSSAFETNLSARVSRRLPPHRPRLVAPSDVPLRRPPRSPAPVRPPPAAVQAAPPPDRGSLSAVLTVFLSPLLFGLVRSPGVDDSVCATMLSRRAQPSPDASPQTGVSTDSGPQPVAPAGAYAACAWPCVACACALRPAPLPVAGNAGNDGNDVSDGDDVGPEWPPPATPAASWFPGLSHQVLPGLPLSGLSVPCSGPRRLSPVRC